MIPEVVIAMASYLPTQDFRDDDLRANAVEIARTVTEAKKPIFATRELDAAVLLTTDFAESRFVHGAVGDGGTALCEFQLHEADRAVLTDLHACVAEGYERIRLSVRMCGYGNPLAQYIGGCDRKSARWQSGLRMSIARRILSEMQKRRELREPSHLIRDMLSSVGQPTRKRIMHAAWPYEPGWYTTNIDGFMCDGETCTRNDARELPAGSEVYFGPGIGEVFCVSCYYERRKRPL